MQMEVLCGSSMPACMFVVSETQYVQNLGQYGVDRDFSASKNQSEEKVSGI